MSASVDTSLRDEQVERTRAPILDAAVALLADDSFTELAIPAVAKRAEAAEVAAGTVGLVVDELELHAGQRAQ